MNEARTTPPAPKVPKSAGRNTPLAAAGAPYRRRWLGLPLLALAGTLATSSARAQFGGGGMPGGGMGGGGHKGGGRPDSDSQGCPPLPRGALPTVAMVKMMVDERLDQLPRELLLDTTRAPVFERYAAAVTQLMDDEVRRSQKPPLPVGHGGNAAQAIEQQITDANSRMAAWEEIQQASKLLMRQLSPAQQAVADKRLVVSIDPKSWAVF